MSSILEFTPDPFPLRIGIQGKPENLSIDGITEDVDAPSKEGYALLERLQSLQLQIRVLSNQQALLTIAKNAHIADFKSEIVRGRTGVGLGALFNDD
jgi:hypothetical protein